MAAPATTKATIKKQTVKEMKKLGTYRPEYDRIVDIYAGLWEQYHRLMKEYDQDGRYGYASSTADGGEKKSPLVATIEAVRRDILTYSDRLMLNPRSERESKNPPTQKRSKLEEVLASVGG